MKKKTLVLLVMMLTFGLCSCNFTFGDGEAYDPGEDINNPSEKTALADNYDKLYKHYYYSSVKKMPSSGNAKMLVIPVWFNDSTNLGFATNKQSTYIANIQNALFGTQESTGWQSVSSYYFLESFGKLNISGKVSDFYYSNLTTAAITDNNSTKNLVTNAVKWYANNNTDLESFDSDNDGYIDTVTLVYAAPNYTSNLYEETSPQKQSQILWAFTHWANTIVDTKRISPYIFASYDFLLKDTSNSTIDAHTFIHETGHALGLTDYYDYNNENGKKYAGSFSMQDFNVGGHDPFSVMALGWINPYIANANEDIELIIKDFQSSGDVIMIPVKGDTSKSAFNEYILLELYTWGGLNYFDSLHQYCFGRYQYPSGSTSYGIRMWHVDSRLIYTSTINGSFNNNTVVGVGNSGYYYYATSNTTYDSENNASYNEYAAKLQQFRNYRLLTLIRNGDFDGEKLNEDFSSANMFRQGNSFKLSNYSGYFQNNKFNNGADFGYEIKIAECSPLGAKIQINILD